MKKIFNYICIGTLALATLTACLQNEEPEGLENLRNARSEMYKSEAAVKTAELALLEAQVEFQKATVEAEQLNNKLKEVNLKLEQLKIKEKELEVEAREAQNAHDAKILELELAIAEQKAQLEIDKLEKSKKEIEVAMLEIENEILEQKIQQAKLDHEKEQALIAHKQNMLAAQLKLAEADAKYQKALEELALNAQGISQAERDKIDELINQIDYLSNQLGSLNIDLIDAQEEYLFMKNNPVLNDSLMTLKFQLEIQGLQEDIDYIKKEREIIASLDITKGNEEWNAQKEDLEKKIQLLDIEISKMELSKVELNEKLSPYYSKLNQIEMERDETDLQLDSIDNALMDLEAFKNEKKDYAFEIDPFLADLLYCELVPGKIYVDDDANDFMITNLYKIDQENKAFVLKENKLSWNTSGSYNHEFLKHRLIPVINNLKISPVAREEAIANTQKIRTLLEADKAEFAELEAKWLANLSEQKVVAEKYGLVNNRFVGQTIHDKAVEAADSLPKLWKNSAKDEAAKVVESKELCVAIFTDQDLRHKLANKAVDKYEELNPEDEKWETNIKLSTFRGRYVNAVSEKISNDPVEKFDYKESMSEFKSLNQIHTDLAHQLYGNIKTIVDRPIAEYFKEDFPFKYMQDADFAYDLDDGDWVIAFEFVNDRNLMNQTIADLYPNFNFLMSSRWVTIKRIEKMVNNTQTLLDMQPQIDALFNALTAVVDEYERHETEGVHEETIKLRQRRNEILKRKVELDSEEKSVYVELIRYQMIEDANIAMRINDLNDEKSLYEATIVAINDILAQQKGKFGNIVFDASMDPKKFEEMKEEYLRKFDLDNDLEEKESDLIYLKEMYELYKTDGTAMYESFLKIEEEKVKNIQNKIAIINKELEYTRKVLNDLLTSVLEETK